MVLIRPEDEPSPLLKAFAEGDPSGDFLAKPEDPGFNNQDAQLLKLRQQARRKAVNRVILSSAPQKTPPGESPRGR